MTLVVANLSDVIGAEISGVDLSRRLDGETGRKAIYVNRLTTEHIVGIPPEDSDAALARIYDHAEDSAFIYEHVWRRGDLMLWDNRCSMHGRTDFPDGERRLM